MRLEGPIMPIEELKQQDFACIEEGIRDVVRFVVTWIDDVAEAGAGSHLVPVWSCEGGHQAGMDKPHVVVVSDDPVEVMALAGDLLLKLHGPMYFVPMPPSKWGRLWSFAGLPWEVKCAGAFVFDSLDATKPCHRAIEVRESVVGEQLGVRFTRFEIAGEGT